MADGRPLRRAPWIVFGLAVIGAMIAPVFREPPRDSFPLSDYPMFSTVRGPAYIDVVVGFDAEGTLHRIPPRLVANAEVMQAAQTVALAVRSGRARVLCEEVAARVAADPSRASIVRLEVQSRYFDPRTYFAGDGPAEPLRLLRRGRCEVPR
ncbi:MAG: hypothetical protein GXY23_03015 [Myxococcales bacterium]|nr:hypothetical protein [Myxococcales bacterium]